MGWGGTLALLLLPLSAFEGISMVEVANPQGTANGAFRQVVAVGDVGNYRCSGSLVDARVISTARHCLPATRVLFGDSVRGAVDVVTVVDSAKPREAERDVALLFLERAPGTRVDPFVFRPTLLASMPPIGMVRFVGFGATDSAGTLNAGVNRWAEVPANGWGCSPQLDCVPGLEMVVPPFAGRDTCRGDSGGPLLQHFGSFWALIAVTSRKLPVNDAVCGGGGIYTRVDAIRAWLAREGTRACHFQGGCHDE